MVQVILRQDASVYFGQVNSVNEPHGHGTWTSADATQRYEGQWQNGVRHGRGSMTYDVQGDTYYSGDWVQGRKQGTGVQVFLHGERYHGSFLWGKPSGIGTIYEQEGGRGRFIDGIFQAGGLDMITRQGDTSDRNQPAHEAASSSAQRSGTAVR